MFNSFSNFLDIFFIFFPFSILCFFTFYPLIEGNIYINVKVSNCDDSMISMEYFSIIRTERTRKRENFWILRLQQRIGKSLEIIVREKFYAILSLTTSSSTVLVSSRKRSSIALHFHESVITRVAEGKPALKRICSPREERLKSL